MRQKEKRRLRRESEERASMAALQRRREAPGDPLFIPINSAECSRCYAEFDPRLSPNGCPCCSSR